MKIADSHVHIRGYNGGKVLEILQGIYKIKELMHLETLNVASLPSFDRGSFGQNLLCILYKILYPGCFAYAGLDYHHGGVIKSAEGFLDQAKNYMAMGFDGIKIIEYKPSVYKQIGAGMNTPLHRDFFNFLEKNAVPVLWHAVDPEENWDGALCGDYAKQFGWYYGNGEFPSKEEFMGEVETILDEHPKLNVVFAHMLFLTGNLKGARDFMDRHKNVRLDTTPGTEMYFNFVKDRAGWRDFFIEYQDRILFGTDNGWGDDASPAQKAIEGCGKIAFLDAFFSTAQTIRAWNDTPVKGLELPEGVLRKFYFENFYAMTGNSGKPRAPDIETALRYARFLEDNTRSLEKEFPEQVLQVREMGKILSDLKQGKKP